MSESNKPEGFSYTFGKDKEGSIPPLIPSEIKPEAQYYFDDPIYSKEQLIIEEYEKLIIPSDNVELIEFKKKLTFYIKEFLTTGLGEEFYLSISEIDRSMFRYEIVKKIIDIGFDQINVGKELVSKLLSYLYSKLLMMKDVEVGFYCLLKRENDLSLDIPNLYLKLGGFIARAIIDEVLPPSYISRVEFQNIPSIKYAKIFLTFPENYTQGIWGKHSSGKLADIQSEIAEILRLYFLNADLKQCMTEINFLHCEYYHHEVIRKAISLAMDYGLNGETLLVNLIKKLFNSGATPLSQIKNGFLRIESNLDELKVDVPKADIYLKLYKEELEKVKIII